MKTTSFKMASLLAGVAFMTSLGSLEHKDDQIDAAEIAKLIKTQVDTAIADAVKEVKAIGTELTGRVELGEKASETLKGDVDEKLTAAGEKITELKTVLEDFQQKAARGMDDTTALQTVGQMFVNSDEFKNAFGSGVHQGASARLQLKTITSLTTDADGSAGDLADVQRVQSPMPQAPKRQFTIRSLLAPGQTNSKSIEYVQETGFTNNARTVAETTEKPESSLKLDLKTAPVRKLAHFMRASTEILADGPGLRSMIDGRLRYGLEFVEENQLLNGDGTGQNLLGIRPQASEFDPAFAVQDETDIDKIRLAILQAYLAEYPPTGIILNPTNWARIETTKDSQGRYIIGNPQGSINKTLWSLPVVETQAMDVGRFLTGSFGLAAQIFDRMEASVVASTEDRDNFIKNLVTILAEQRLALAVYRPEAFIEGELAAIAAA